MLTLAPSDMREQALGADTYPLRLRAAMRLAANGSAHVDRSVIVKSVHSALALDWVAARWDPTVLIVIRSPLNVLASYRDLDMPDQDRRLYEQQGVKHRLVSLGVPMIQEDASPLSRSAWQLALLMTSLLASAERHGWPVLVHDEACIAPSTVFPGLAGRLGLPWSDAGNEYLRRSNRPGAGFSDRRIASEQKDRWRRSLEPSQASEALGIIAQFPLVDDFLSRVR